MKHKLLPTKKRKKDTLGSVIAASAVPVCAIMFLYIFNKGQTEPLNASTPLQYSKFQDNTNYNKSISPSDLIPTTSNLELRPPAWTNYREMGSQQFTELRPREIESFKKQKGREQFIESNEAIERILIPRHHNTIKVVVNNSWSDLNIDDRQITASIIREYCTIYWPHIQSIDIVLADKKVAIITNTGRIQHR